MVFVARRSYASAVFGVLILSVCPSVTRVLCDYPKNLQAVFFIPHESAIIVVKCDISYSCAAADKISTDV